MIKCKFLQKEKPTHNMHQVFQATNWFLIFEAYEICTSFTPTERPPEAEILEMFENDNFLPQCRAIPLKVSQTTAVAQYDHSAILEGTELKEPQEIFLCLLIFDHLYGDKNSPLSEDCWRKTTASVEDIIVSSPGNFNHLGDLYKFYASEANQLLRNGASIRNLDFILCRVGMH